MSGDSAVQDAIERWARDGLISEALAHQLRNEVSDTAATRNRRSAQYAFAITAGVVLLTASALFINRSWPLLPTSVRTFILGAVGAALIGVGVVIEPRSRVRPVGYLLQTSGLLMLLFAYAHSDLTWSKGTVGGVVAGLFALATPIVSSLLAFGRNPVMPAVNAAVGYAFLAFFLNRIGVNEDAIVWLLDGVLLVTLGLLLIRLRQASPDSPYLPTALYAFIASMLAGLVLTGLTAAGPLGARGGTIYALDLWLALIVATALWAVHNAPEWLRRPWYDDILAGCVLVGAVFAFITLDEMGFANDWNSLGGGLVGAAALAYGVKTGTNSILLTGAIAVVISVWHFGISQAGSLGAIGSLVVTAGLLFWTSSRLGKNMQE